MEVKEIISYFFNNESNIVEVVFRTISDSDEEIRTDNIDYRIIEEYGFDLITESFNFFEDEFEDDVVAGEEKIELDEEELIIFLNEYYTINPKFLPKSQSY
jgi:hypothetical protein